MGAFPIKSQRTLRYSEIVQLSVSSGFGSFLFSANGMYDPNTTGLGHQPMGFDQLMAVYNHYHVIASSITVTCCQPLAFNDNYQMAIVLAPSTSTSTIGDIATACEQEGAVFRTLSANTNLTAPLRKSWKWKSTFYDKSADGGQSGSNPAEQSFYQIFVNDVALSTFSLNLKVDIQYTAVFDEPRNFVSS